MDRELQKRLFNLCLPEEALPPGDPRWVDLDASGARGPRWTDVLAGLIELARRPTPQLLTGIPGSGLSTQLLGLGARLADPSGANLLVVHVGAGEVVDPSAPIDIADVLVAVVGRTHEAVAAISGGDATSPGRFRRWLPALSPSDDGGESAPFGRYLRELRHVVPARARLRLDVSAEFSRFIADVRGELGHLVDRARRLGRAGIAVLFDGLERLRGSTTTHRQVLASAEKLFGADAEYLELPVHTLYTLPPALLLRLRREVHILPALRVHDRSGKPDVGIETAREVVRRRIPDDALDELLGAGRREERVHQLIERTGGHLRDLVRLLQRVVTFSERDEKAFDRLLGSLTDIPGRLLTEQSYRWLAKVRSQRALAADEGIDVDAEIALGIGAALPYQDAEGVWFDVAPAPRRLRSEVIARRRAAT